MNSKLEIFLTQLDHSKSIDDVWSIIVSFYKSFGFDRIIYIDLELGEVDILTSFPQYWLDHYIDQNYQDIDPFFMVCCKNFTSMGTGIEYLKKYDFLDEVEKKLIKEASEAGMQSGFSIVFNPLTDIGAGGWNIGSSLSLLEVQKIKAENFETLHLASFYAREAIKSIRKKSKILPNLSNREKECLLWLTTGLRTKEIAYRLNLKPVSVELYINNAKKKMGANTREQAIAKAITQNLIQL